MATHSSVLAWRIPGTGEPGGLQSRVAQSWTQLNDFTFTFYSHTLEKEMATHSSVLAWRIPGTGEPGGLLSMGSHRVGHGLKRLSSSSNGSVGFPGGSVLKDLPANAGDTKDVGSFPVSGRSPGGGYGNPLQYSCLGNPMDRGTWWATVHGISKSCT